MDGFQGREKEIIVFSAVRCRGVVGFLSDFKRLNVMLTRARRGLIVIGDSTTLNLYLNWRTWLQHITDNQVIIGKIMSE